MTNSLDPLSDAVSQFFLGKMGAPAPTGPGSVVLVLDAFGTPLTPGEFGVGGTTAQQQLFAHARAAQLADQVPAENLFRGGWYLARQGSRLSRWYGTAISGAECVSSSASARAAFEARKASAGTAFSVNALPEAVGVTGAGTTVDPTGVMDTNYATGIAPPAFYAPGSDVWEPHTISTRVPAAAGAAAGDSRPPFVVFHRRRPDLGVLPELESLTGVESFSAVGGPVVLAGPPLTHPLDRSVPLAHGPVVYSDLVAPVESAVPQDGVVADDAGDAADSAAGIDVAFEYCIVRFSRPWWDEVFLSSADWMLPGYYAGQIASGNPADPADLIPAIAVGAAVVRNLSITADWNSGQRASLAASNSLGPFSTSGASLAGGTLSRAGMQVVAWICQVPPVLPPRDDPSLPPRPVAPPTTPTTASTGTSAGPGSDGSGPVTVADLAARNVTCTVPEADLASWLADPATTPYPALAQALLSILGNRRFAVPVPIDCIRSDYEEELHYPSPRRRSDVDDAGLQKAVIATSHEQNGTDAAVFTDLLE
ncbi:dihydrolipoamide acyltransferase [Tsukamurella sp. NPDC003166]|uniref:dihydrolipoamide acyltransferase n=1 Tax=Tsukamurella sp. NPDC003166 TaxID=3154444 RepID=UPI0033A8BF26